MRTRTSGAVLAAVVAGVLVLTGCGGGSEPEPVTASDPPAMTLDPNVEGAAGADAAAEDEDPVRARQEACEPTLLESFDSERPQRGQIDDLVQVHGVVQMLFPTAPTCHISYMQGEQRMVVQVWLDEPGTAPAVIEELESQGWSASAAPGAGYDMTTLTGGSAPVEVHPIGVDNSASGIGQLWDDVDVTMITVLLPPITE